MKNKTAAATSANILSAVLLVLVLAAQATARPDFSFGKITHKRIRYAISHRSGTSDTVTGYSGLETELESVELPPSKCGEKFSVKWRCRLPRATGTPPAQGLLRMEFFTETTGYMLTREQKVDLRRGRFRNVFRHTGSDYRENGKITHWRFTLLDAEGNALCAKTSPMWDNLPALALKQKTVWKPRVTEQEKE